MYMFVKWKNILDLYIRNLHVIWVSILTFKIRARNIGPRGLAQTHQHRLFTWLKSLSRISTLQVESVQISSMISSSASYNVISYV